MEENSIPKGVQEEQSSSCSSALPCPSSSDAAATAEEEGSPALAIAQKEAAEEQELQKDQALSLPTSSTSDPEQPFGPRKLVDRYKAAASERSNKVILQDLLDFLFVRNEQQHSPSTGRLFAFGLYGPLDKEKRLRSGSRGEHVLQTWELEVLCRQFEKEDIVQTYLPFRFPISTLTQAEMQAVVSQADQRLKAGKSRWLLPQLTEAEVLELVEDLPQDEEGCFSFHDLQKVIMQFRMERIAKFKITYPEPPGKEAQIKAKARAEKVKARKAAEAQAQAEAEMVERRQQQQQQQQQQEELIVALTSQDSASARGAAAGPPVSGAGDFVGDDGGEGEEGGRERRAPIDEKGRRKSTIGTIKEGEEEEGPSTMRKTQPIGLTAAPSSSLMRKTFRVSAKVAPPEMFLKDKGARDTDFTAVASQLLHKNTFRISALADGNSVDLLQNVRLLRDDDGGKRRGKGKSGSSNREWDKHACFQGTETGARIQCAKSSSTAKRKVTIA